MSTRIACLPAAALVLAAFPACAATPRLEVAAPDQRCADLPMGVDLPAGFEATSVTLTKPDGSRVPAQVLREGERRVLVWIVDGLAAGQALTYGIDTQAAPAAAPGVEVKPTPEGADITVRGEPFTSYVSLSGIKPILYPILGPKGKPMTRNYPMKTVAGEKNDHPHHRSFWFTHGSVNGVDFWAETAKSGKIVQTSIRTESGPVAGTVETTDDWVAPDGRKVCADRRLVRVYNAAAGRLFDIAITLRATDTPVVLGDTKEGTFAFRTAAGMEPDAKQGGRLVNAAGLLNQAVWGKPSTWVDASGPVAGETLGLAILEHPASFRAPTTWHARTYGLVAANPFGLRDFTGDKTRDGSHALKPGEEITFRFRIWLHEGDEAKAGVAAAWHQYAQPPKATFVP